MKQEPFFYTDRLAVNFDDKLPGWVFNGTKRPSKLEDDEIMKIVLFKKDNEFVFMCEKVEENIPPVGDPIYSYICPTSEPVPGGDDPDNEHIYEGDMLEATIEIHKRNE